MKSFVTIQLTTKMITVVRMLDVQEFQDSSSWLHVCKHTKTHFSFESLPDSIGEQTCQHLHSISLIIRVLRVVLWRVYFKHVCPQIKCQSIV